MMIDTLLSHWRCRGSALDDENILVPRRLLLTLVLVALRRKVVSEEGYLAMHPDVRAAIDDHHFASAMQHFIWEGLREGREIPDLQLDPDRYLALNLDLAKSPAADNPDSLRQHWLAGRQADRLMARNQ